MMKKLYLTVFVVSIFGVTSVPNAKADGYRHCYDATTQCMRACRGNEQCFLTCHKEKDRCLQEASRRLHSGKKKGGREK